MAGTSIADIQEGLIRRFELNLLDHRTETFTDISLIKDSYCNREVIINDIQISL